MNSARPPLVVLVMALAATLLGLAASAPAAWADHEVDVGVPLDTEGYECGEHEPCTLRSAIEQVDAGRWEGAVTLKLHFTGKIETGDNGVIDIDPPSSVTSVTIEPVLGTVELDGEEETRILEVDVDEGVEVNLVHLALTNGARTGSTGDLEHHGGAALFQAGGDVTLSQVTVKNNQVDDDRDGGAIFVDDGNLTVEDSTLEGNRTESSALQNNKGGAIFEETGNARKVRLVRVALTDNGATEGGAIFQDEGSLEVVEGVLEGNAAHRGRGGAIAAEADGSASTVIEGSKILDNSASGDGGGIFNEDGSGGLTVRGSEVSDNSAGTSGGGLYVSGPTKIIDSTLALNEAGTGSEDHGAGIMQLGSSLKLETSTVARNRGLGVYVSGGTTTILGTTIASNESQSSTAGGLEGGEGVTITSSIVADNVGTAGQRDCRADGDVSEVLVSGGHNVTTEAAGTGSKCEWSTAKGDQLASDPELGLLGDYGGPTETMPPESALSPAINHGAEPAATDQRGEPRPVPQGDDLLTDIGAVEVQAPVLDPDEPPAISPDSGLRAGDELDCAPGTWNTDTVRDPIFSYVWKAGSTTLGSTSKLTLTAADAGRSIVCEVSADDGAETVEATTAAVELAPATATLTPSTLDFGARNVGAGISDPRAVTLKNEGGVTLDVTEVSSSDAVQFPRLDGCGATVEPGGECTIEVRFHPSSTGAQSATLNVDTSVGDKSVALHGTGTAPQFEVAPTSFDFGSRPAGSGAGSPHAFTVTDGGTGPMTIGQVAIAGAHASSFELLAGQDGCSGATLQGGEHCEVQVAFRPAAAGLVEATLEFPGDEAPGAATLSGTGTVPVFSADPSSLDFDFQQLGVVAAARPVTVTNQGGAQMSIGTVALNGADATSFALPAATDGCSGELLAPGDSCTVSVSFTPTTAGPLTATLSFPGSVPVQGTGVAPDLVAEPTSVDFGSLETGASAERTVAVINRSAAAIELDAPLLSGAGADAFAHAGCDGALLAAEGGSCQIAIRFLPVAAGTFAATLEVPSAGGGGTVAVTLAGTATTPPPPPKTEAPAPSPPTVSLDTRPGGKLGADGGGGVEVPVACDAPAGSSCQITLTLIGLISAKATAATAMSTAAPLGTWRGTLAAGSETSVTVPLSAAARATLGKHRKLAAKAVTSIAGGAESSTPVTLIAPAPPTITIRSIRLTGNSLSLSVLCRGGNPHCLGRLSVAIPAAPKPLASAAAKLTPGNHSVRLPLTASARHALVPGLTVLITALARDHTYARTTARTARLPLARG